MSVLVLQVDEVRRTLSASGGAFVVHDKEVDIVRFAINSGFADIVLDGQVALRVMYQRPGESQVRAQTLTYHDTDGLRNYYDWHLLSADLEHKGTITCALCILRADNEVEEWHTTPYQIRVLESIHTDDSDEADETITPTVAERVAVLESMIQRIASGAPIVVSSASDMTDTEQIYVLSTNGYWYYHNGSAWVAGGEYGAVSTDTTLTQPGIPADAKKVGDELTDIKADLGDTQVITNQNLVSIRKAFPASTNLFNADDPNILVGKYITNTGASASYALINTSYFIPVEPLTAYFIGSDQNNFPRYISEYDSTKTLIPNSGASEANITTTANTAYIRFSYRNDSTHWRMTKGNTKQPYEPYYYDYIKTDDTLTNEYLPANARAVGEKIESLGFTEVEYVADDALNLTWTEGYVDKGGRSHSGASYHYSNHIPVSEGDEIYTNGTYTLRFVCAYNSVGQAVSASGAESVIRYTVPSGITEVVVSLLIAYTGEIRHAYTANEFVVSNGDYGYFRAKGNLSDGDTLTLPTTNIDKNIRQVFTADITSFSGVLFGRKSGNNGYWAVIDATNITVYRDNVASTPIPHGLTIENNLQIRIITKHNVSIPNELYNADITVTSNGIDFTAQDIEWRRTYNPPVVQSVGSVLTDCVMSWESGDVGKSIYMFGDSYFSWGVDRWAYYCVKDGFAENALFNAYPGENSANAIRSMRNVVPLGKPKYLVWCLGMNDGNDSESEPSSAWVTGRDAVINLCERYGITPVFTTIPTVPTINHEQKNAWVRSSGYRYIDFAKAVGAQSDGTWFSSMLYTDGVHPTVQGAKALYGRVLTDFPEIMVSN